ncbi:MAG: LysM peptidoglycan-binding domain-containing protein [Firmicutes bacterium]|nr:LysM peptidoglycan-binding domain-containing protein [Bacillota bacterium]
MKRLLVIVISLGLLFLLAGGTAADWTYTVQRGDTLQGIAQRFGVSLGSLRQRNGLWTDSLRVGQRITIPTGATAASTGGWTYTVRRGDTLYTISQRVGVPVNTLRSVNGLASNTLRIGQRLTIPTGGAATATTAGGGSRAGVDTYMLARLIHAEAEAEPYIGKVAVGAVVLNRIESPLFPNSLAGVLYQPHAFETVTNGRIYNNPSNEAIRAARDAVNGWDPSGGALYFFNPAKVVSSWVWTRTIVNRIGKHVFAI